MSTLTLVLPAVYDISRFRRIGPDLLGEGSTECMSVPTVHPRPTTVLRHKELCTDRGTPEVLYPLSKEGSLTRFSVSSSEVKNTEVCIIKYHKITNVSSRNKAHPPLICS